MAPGARWQAPLWGLGRVFALEQPGKWGGLVDLPPQGTYEALVETLLATIDVGDTEDQVAWRAGKRFVARLLPADDIHREPAEMALPVRSDGTYLITGGFGGLGLLVARWLAQNGARHVALLGRNPDANSQAVREIEALGTRVIALTGDVADEVAMKRHLARLAAGAPPLRGIVHAAAALSAAPIGELASEQVRAMLRPKIEGTVLLERLTSSLELDFIVLFSSTTVLLGASGMAHYAAANAFLDATAVALNDSSDVNGRHTLSVNWGTWEAMRLASAESQRSYREGGLEPMPAADALGALGKLLRRREPQATVARINWSVLKPLHEARRIRPLLTHLGNEDVPASAAGSADAPVATAAVPAAALLERLTQSPATLRHELLVDFVRAEAAAVLGVDSGEAVALDVGLFEMGMDSLMSVELRRRLERGAGRKLPSTLTFNYPNVGALAGFLERELVVATQAAEPATNAPVVQTAPAAIAANDNLDELSEAELEARLLARLSETR